jgi:hypothetical protein
MKTESLVIKNAIIDDMSIDDGDRGLLTAWLFLDYGGTHQGFGGISLYLSKDYTHHKLSCGFAGHFIYRCMEIAGVNKWQNLKGKSIRVKLSNDGFGASIISIGHIIKDDWFNPSEDFNSQKQ